MTVENAGIPEERLSSRCLKGSGPFWIGSSLRALNFQGFLSLYLVSSHISGFILIRGLGQQMLLGSRRA